VPLHAGPARGQNAALVGARSTQEESRVAGLERRQLLAGLLTGILTALLWGSWAVVSRLGVTGALGVWDICVLRYATSALVLLPWLLRRHTITRAGIMGVAWPGVAALAITGGLPYMLVVFAGLAEAPASRHAVFGSGVMPLMTLALSRVLLDERPSWRQILGTVVTSAGVLLTVLQALGASDAPLGRGDALFLLSAVLWASYTVAARVHRVPALPAVVILTLTGLVGTLLVYPPVFGLRFAQAPLMEILGQAFYQGIVTGLVGTLLYMRTGELLGASRAALFVALVPPMVTLIAWPVLGEQPTMLSLGGVALVSLGMAIAVLRRG
jgi:drug/metabolite transporter (DMT)-like permease